MAALLHPAPVAQLTVSSSLKTKAAYEAPLGKFSFGWLCQKNWAYQTVQDGIRDSCCILVVVLH